MDKVTRRIIFKLKIKRIKEKKKEVLFSAGKWLQLPQYFLVMKAYRNLILPFEEFSGFDLY